MMMRTFAPLLLLLSIIFCSVNAGQKVTGLPNSQNVNDVSYSGFIQVDPAKTDAKLFYWHFESRSNPAKDPVILWMTGGPGCSSELAVLFENGPFTVDPTLTLQSNPYSWSNNATVIFIDQPFGTGFSPIPRGDFVYNETQMAKYMYNMLQGWFSEYSQYAGRAFYITGESFAGHYIPALSRKIVEENQAGKNPKINFIGAAIGNGYTDPQPQYLSYLPYSVDEGLIQTGTDAYTRIKHTTTLCDAACDKAYSDNATYEDTVYALDICSLIMTEVVRNSPTIDGYPINHYNIKEPCVTASLCYDFTNETAYMNLEGTQKALGVAETWQSCATRSGLPLTLDRLRAYSSDLVPVLAAGVRVLVYSGMWDLICDYIGGESWIQQMAWPGQAAFNATTYADWVVDGRVAGHVRAAQGLTWLEVEEAGHMVPHDQPVAALDMLNRFVAGTSYA